MSRAEAVAFGEGMAFLLLWIDRFFSMRVHDPIIVEARSAELWFLSRALGEWRDLFVESTVDGMAS